MPDYPFGRDGRKPGPRAAAMTALQNYQVKPTAQVGYQSHGVVLMIGTADQVLTAIQYAPGSLTAHAAILGNCTSAAMREFDRRIMPVLEIAEIPEITGYLGHFRVTVEIDAVCSNVAQHLGASEGIYDLVLDLNNPPILEKTLPLIGYFATRGNSESVEPMVTGLTEWVGEFDKPKYFDFQADLCAHSASELSGCRLCLGACAAQAISSVDGRIRVDPYLCQGCGECSTVCPSGAINYQYPSRTDTLTRLRHMFGAYASAGGQLPTLLLHDDETGIRWVAENYASLPDSFLPFGLESIGSVGMDIWLAALAYGAAKVLIMASEGTRPQTRHALNAQLGYAREILGGMGLNTDLINIVSGDDIKQADLSINNLRACSFKPAGFSGVEDKRTAIRLAVDHLYQHSSKASNSVRLSDGAPFGDLVINTDRCTLCMACVSVCPESALADGSDQPRLNFIEANCVQCGLCKTACPEDAISLAPRYVYDGQQARQTRLLHEVAVFRCVECGDPFATASMIETITERLKNHPMFQGENMRRLKMCEDCRVKAMFGSASPPDSGHARRTV